MGNCIALDFLLANYGSVCTIANTGMAQREGMGREEGGGFGMGNTCIPVADSF